MKSNVLKNYDKELGMLILVNIGMFIYWSDNSQLWNFLEHNKIFLSFFISFLSPLLITDCIPAGWKDLLILYLQARDSSGIYKLVVRFIPHYWIEGFQRYVFLPGFCIFSNLEDNRIKNEKVKMQINGLNVSSRDRTLMLNFNDKLENIFLTNLPSLKNFKSIS